MIINLLTLSIPKNFTWMRCKQHFKINECKIQTKYEMRDHIGNPNKFLLNKNLITSSS